MSKIFEKCIIIQNGKICIKEENGDISDTKEDSIPEILKKIDDYIKNNPKIFRVQDIIFSVIGDYFSIQKVLVKSSDPLYDFLLTYISNNSIYRERIILKREDNLRKYERKKKNRAELYSYYDFLCERVYIEKKKKNLRR